MRMAGHTPEHIRRTTGETPAYGQAFDYARLTRQPWEN